MQNDAKMAKNLLRFFHQFSGEGDDDVVIIFNFHRKKLQFIFAKKQIHKFSNRSNVTITLFAGIKRDFFGKR